MPINKDTPMGDVIKDFQKSTAPQFKGKSPEKKRQMAIAAKLNAEDFEGLTVEEQLDLISYMPLAMQEEAKKLLGLEEKRGLWDNIHAKRKRIKAGSGERMRKPGSKGAPTAQDFKNSQSEETEVEEKYDPEAKYGGPPHDTEVSDKISRGVKSGKIKLQKPKKQYDPEAKYGGPAHDTHVSDKISRGVKSGKLKLESFELTEATDKLMYLARLGLVNRNEVALLRKALKVKSSGEPISPRYRDLMLKVMDKLINIVLTDKSIYNKTRRAVTEEVEIVEMFETVLTEAGYCDPPKNMKEFRKKFPNLDKKIKSTDSGDFNKAVTPSKISEQYVNHLNFLSKK